MWGAPSSPGWRHSATTLSQWSRDVQAASRRLPSGIALRVADYEDSSALKRALAGIDDMVLISSDGDASAVTRHHGNAIEAATATNIRHINFHEHRRYRRVVAILLLACLPRRRAPARSLQCVPSTILRCGRYSDVILKHWLVPSQTSGELVLPTGHGRVAPISRDDVAAAVAAIAAKANKSINLASST
jgi:NAD(P)H dehydrogenase (quinone)